MSRHRSHEIVNVYPHAVQDELVDLVRRENISQTMITKQILRSSGLTHMVEAVASGENEGIRVEIVIRG